MGKRNGLLAPARDPFRREQMAQVVQSRPRPGTVTDNPTHQASKSPVGSAHLERSTERTDKETVGQRVICSADALIILQRPHGRRVERQYAFWTLLNGRDAQHARRWIKVVIAQANGLRGPKT